MPKYESSIALFNDIKDREARARELAEAGDEAASRR